MSRETSLAKNTMVIALGTFLPRLASFVTLPILTGLLTREEYGIYDLVTVMVSLLLPSLTLQVHAAAFRFLISSRGDDARQRTIVTNVFALVLPVSAVVLVVLFFILAHFTDGLVSLLVCAYFFAEIIGVDMRQIARGYGRNLDYSLSSIVAAAGSAVGACVLVWGAGLGLVGAVGALALANGLSAYFLAMRLRVWKLVSPSTVDVGVLREMLAYSWPVVPNELSLWVMNLSDRLIVTAVLGVAANAVYAVANKIPHAISMAQGAFTLAWQENASLASDDKDAGAYYSRTLKVVYGLEAGFFGAVLAAAPFLFRLLVRGDYADAYPQMPLLCLGMFFSGMATFMGGIYVARLETKSIASTTVAAAISNIVINALLVGRIGLWAASLSTAVSFAALLVFRMLDVRRLVDIEYDWLYMGGVLALLLLEAALSYVHRPITDVANVVLAVIAFVGLNQTLVRYALGIARRKLRSGGNKG